MKRQYKNEADFKKDFVDALRKEGYTMFCVETEETEPGFPDVMAIHDDMVSFFEMKITDKKGIFKMQKTQPVFYKRYPNLDITVVVHDGGMGNYLSIPAKLIANSCAEHGSLKLDIREFLYKAAFAEGEVKTGRKE